MKRIIIHWTAGRYYPTKSEKLHYHYLIGKDGVKHDGKYKPEDNENCGDGYYAQHAGGGNTGSIGVSMCGMYNFRSRNNVGDFPLTKVQCEACFKLVADLAKKYNIPINEDSIMTHYEFGLKHPKSSSSGKIDIVYLPPYSHVTQKQIGDFIRNKVYWYSTH